MTHSSFFKSKGCLQHHHVFWQSSEVTHMLRSRDHICESLLSPFPCFIDITDHCLTRVSPPLTCLLEALFLNCYRLFLLSYIRRLVLSEGTTPVQTTVVFTAGQVNSCSLMSFQEPEYLTTNSEMDDYVLQGGS